MVLAAGSGPHRWALAQGVEDNCSAQSNPLSALIYLLADLTGSGSVVTSALILWAKPPGGKYGLLWVVMFGIAAVLIQLTLVDMVPWRHARILVAHLPHMRLTVVPFPKQ